MTGLYPSVKKAAEEEALVAGDQATDRAMLHADFLGVYSDGFGDKGAHVAQLAGGPVVQSYEMTGCRVMVLGPDHAVLSYHATYLRAGHTVAEAMYVSSIWQRAGRTWVNVFSQDTAAVS